MFVCSIASHRYRLTFTPPFVVIREFTNRGFSKRGTDRLRELPFWKSSGWGNDHLGVYRLGSDRTPSIKCSSVTWRKASVFPWRWASPWMETGRIVDRADFSFRNGSWDGAVAAD